MQTVVLAWAELPGFSEQPVLLAVLAVDNSLDENNLFLAYFEYIHDIQQDHLDSDACAASIQPNYDKNFSRESYHIITDIYWHHSHFERLFTCILKKVREKDIAGQEEKSEREK